MTGPLKRIQLLSLQTLLNKDAKPNPNNAEITIRPVSEFIIFFKLGWRNIYLYNKTTILLLQ
jgi:hypothetical protein